MITRRTLDPRRFNFSARIFSQILYVLSFEKLLLLPPQCDRSTKHQRRIRRVLRSFGERCHISSCLALRTLARVFQAVQSWFTLCTTRKGRNTPQHCSLADFIYPFKGSNEAVQKFYAILSRLGLDWDTRDNVFPPTADKYGHPLKFIKTSV
jgi:hypothetical protein